MADLRLQTLVSSLTSLQTVRSELEAQVRQQRATASQQLFQVQLHFRTAYVDALISLNTMPVD